MNLNCEEEFPLDLIPEEKRIVEKTPLSFPEKTSLSFPEKNSLIDGFKEKITKFPIDILFLVREFCPNDYDFYFGNWDQLSEKKILGYAYRFNWPRLFSQQYLSLIRKMDLLQRMIYDSHLWLRMLRDKKKSLWCTYLLLVGDAKECFPGMCCCTLKGRLLRESLTLCFKTGISISPSTKLSPHVLNCLDKESMRVIKVYYPTLLLKKKKKGKRKKRNFPKQKKRKNKYPRILLEKK